MIFMFLDTDSFLLIVLFQMTTSSTFTYDQAYQMARDGYTGNPAVWDNIFNYITQHPNDLFLVAPNRRWSIGHQIVYYGHLKLLKRILALYKSENSIDIQSKTKDSPTPWTILDVAIERKGHYKEQLAYIERLFAQDRFLRACKACQWPVIEEMLTKDPSLLNEKPPYYSNYFLHYLALEGDARTLCQYGTSDTPFDFNLPNADGKTALELARERKNQEFIDQLQQMMTPRLDRADRRSPDRLSETSSSQNSTAPSVVASPSTTQNMICPITKRRFVDPVIASDGQTYERSAIIEWLQQYRYSPKTGEMISDVFIENTSMKKLIARSQQTK